MPGSLASDTLPTFSDVLNILSGDHNSLKPSSRVREKGSPALQYLLQMSQEPGQMKDSQLRPVPRFDDKYNFFRTPTRRPGQNLKSRRKKSTGGGTFSRTRWMNLREKREELLAEEKEREERRSRVNIFLHRGWRPDGLSGLLQRRMKMISSVVNI